MPRQSIESIRPQDIVVLLKLSTDAERNWTQIELARELFMSQSEISQSLVRSNYAGLIMTDQTLHLQALLDFLQYGLAYVYPQRPGPVVRGISTAHSTLPLSEEIMSEEKYVWPYAKGDVRGRSIKPLYPSVVEAVQIDTKLHQLLALTDALRIGRAREKNLALYYLRKRLC